MADAGIFFDRVWKKFRRGDNLDSLTETLMGLFKRRRLDPDALKRQEFWAVRDVSFEVRPGEALGIIGPNGAGKSTILKLLTRILRPTRGQCALRGRVGSLIEILRRLSRRPVRPREHLPAGRHRRHETPGNPRAVRRHRRLLGD